MSKEIYISSTPHETRLAIVENDALTEIYYERENEYTLAGSIYNGKVTRVLPGMQSSFVDIGLERDAFLYITDFMEEAPDSAEFDTSSLGEGNQRLPRLEGSAETPQRESQRDSQPRESQPRDGRGDRNDRGDRSRGRARRDRIPNGNRTPQGGQPTPEFSRPDSNEEPQFEAPPIATASEPAYLQASGATENSEIGEGAPGADGSRRWRGRRGRRRGRGPVTNGAPQDQSQRSIAAGSEQTDFAVEVHHEAPEEFEPLIETEVTTEVASAPASLWASVPSPGESDSEEPPYGQGRGDAGRGDRARSNRDRVRNDRGGRPDRFDRPARVPRGFAPSRSLYGVDSEPVAENDAPAEPIILPGESLSKYRPGGESSTPAPASAATPAPSSEYTIPTGWDGGSILPGESLSRHRRPESRPEAHAEQRSSAPRTNFIQPAAVVVPAITVLAEPDGPSVADTPQTQIQAQAEVALAAHPELVPEAETIHQLSVSALSAAAEPAPIAEPVAAAESEAAPTDYEPQEGFASYRVDPIAPSEFRQSAPVVELEHPEPELAHSPSEAEVLESLKDREPSHDGFGNTHLLTPEPIGPTPILHDVPPVETVAAPESAILPAHDITTLNPMGEMVSLPPVEEHPLMAHAADLEPVTTPEDTEAEPIAVAPPLDLVEEQTDELDEEEDEPTQNFAPGSGELEEELIDDEEYEVAALHAGYEDEMDDLEEETLEGAADLGTMLREMSIDEITRTSPEAGEEEEFEEDTEETNGHDFEQAEEDSDSEEYARTAESAGDFSNDFREPEPSASTDAEPSYNERRGGRRDVRRGGRDRDPARDPARRTGGDSSSRPRNNGGSGERERGRSNTGRGRMSMQSTNLPAISELLKPGQEILVQIAKEPIAKKGARITSHIALPGRFLVFMPTVNHTGVSRKIESDGERRRLKEILLSEKGEAAGGFIVRTAASGASEEELRSDLRFLLNLWTDIKNRSESSKSPALIYHDLNLVERVLRDQVTDNFSAIWVDTETEYERVLRFLQRFQPALIRRVKLYGKDTPLFEQFGITEEINKALRSKVWLKSGGSIVINQTEALVAIDINTGKFVGKTARLEDTIVKTNLDAIPEIVRQIRLRDLGGIIIIDFIDMDERKNRNRVMAALEEELKSDRAPSKVLQFNDFGLVAITRKRVKQSLERTLSTTCGVCQGTGMVKSPVTVCNDIYVEMRKMHKHLDKGDVMLRVNPEVVKQLKSSGTRWLQEMEEMSGKTILVKSDPSLHPEQFDIH